MQNKPGRVESSKAVEAQKRIFEDLKFISQIISTELIKEVLTFALGADYEMSPNERARGYKIFANMDTIIRVFDAQNPESFHDAPILLDHLVKLVSFEARQAERDFLVYITALANNGLFFEYFAENSLKLKDLFRFMQLMLSLFHSIEDNGMPDIETEIA